jgi:hypothetical protein
LVSDDDKRQKSDGGVPCDCQGHSDLPEDRQITNTITMNAIILVQQLLLQQAAWLAVARVAPVRFGAVRLNPVHAPRRPQPVARAVVRQQPYSRRLISKRGHF